MSTLEGSLFDLFISSEFSTARILAGVGGSGSYLKTQSAPFGVPHGMKLDKLPSLAASLELETHPG